MARVDVIDLGKSYGSARAVDGVSLAIGAGEFVTLLGPSGCGKTTTLRMIAGLIVPDSGRIAIGGVDVTAIPTHRRNIGMVFQSHALFPHMTVAENVGFGLRMRGGDRSERDRRVLRALEMVRLETRASSMPSQLSGGQQQRVALARALAFSPDVLLLDEPFGALDRKLRELMQDELRDLTRRLGMTSVFVTHDQEEALKMSDRVAVMNAGRLEQIGAPDEVFERPRTRFVADFMGFGNIIEAIGTGPTTAVADGVSLHAETTLPAGKITVAIRAERIDLSANGQPGPNSAAGTIAGTAYQGSLATYRVHLDGERGATLDIRETNRTASGRPRFDVGARVWATWQPGAVRVLE